MLPKVIASTVNDDGAAVITSKSARVAGDVEGVDKLLTFLFVGALGACSDGVGRKPLIALSALGYATTVLVQARATKVAHFFAADAIDGLTSCMNAVCAAFVADATAQDSGAARAAALGVFQGLSVGGAFIVGFPMAAILSKGGKYRKPMYLAASLQLLNAFLALFVTPESALKSKGIKWDEANPISSLGQLDLFKASTPLKKTAIAFSLVWLGNLALNACFVPYVDAKFGWGPQQSGPLLVVVGLMLAVVPKLVVPRLGVVGAANFGCLVYALGFICAALAPTGPQYVAAIVVCGFGAVAVPALTSIVAGAADSNSKGVERSWAASRRSRSSRRPRATRCTGACWRGASTGTRAFRSARRTSPRRRSSCSARSRRAGSRFGRKDYLQLMYKTRRRTRSTRTGPASRRRGAATPPRSRPPSAACGDARVDDDVAQVFERQAIQARLGVREFWPISQIFRRDSKPFAVFFGEYQYFRTDDGGRRLRSMQSRR